MTVAARFRQIVTIWVLSSGLFVLAACSSSEERAENHYQRGMELVEIGEFSKAGLEFRNAIKLDSDHIDALYAFGGVQERIGEVQAAFRVYNSVAEQDKTHVPARLKLVYLLLGANQTEQAQKFLDEANEIAPEDAETLVANATLKLRTGDPEEAEKIASLALDRDPNAQEAYIVLATARMTSGDPIGALKVVDAAPQSSRGNAALQILRLTILERLGDDTQTEAQFAQMVERFPDEPQFGVAWAQWYASKDRVDDAESVMRQLANDRPDDDEAQMRLVSFVMSRKGPVAATNELESLIDDRNQAGGQVFPLQAALAQLKYSTGDRSEAIGFVQSMLDEASETEEKNRARLMLASMLVDTGDTERAASFVSEILETDAKNVEALRLSAAIKMSKNDSAGAADDILLALDEAPDDARLRVLLASAHERNGSAVLAEEEYAKAFAIDNQSAETGLPMVRYLLSHGRTEQAERILETIRQRHPSNRDVLVLLAERKLARKDFVSAQELADLLRNSDDENSDAIADRITAAALGGQNKHKESLNFLEQSVSSSEGETNSLFPDLVRAYIQAGKLDLAIEKVNAALEENPEDLQARMLLGAVFMSSGNVEKAEEAFRQAAADETNASGNAALAQFYFSTQELDKAEETLLAGIAKDENSTALQMVLATLYQQTDRFDEAIAIFEKMHDQDPSSTVVANDLASLLSERREDQSSLDRAMEIAQRFRTSEIPQYQDTLGWIYYLKGQYSSALPLLRASAEGLPNMGLAQYHYGMTLAALDQKQQAIEVLQRALDLKTLMTEADQELARTTMARLQKPEAAAEAN